MGRKRQQYSHLSDEEIMVRVIGNDALAFEVLYDRYAQKMINYFYHMLWKDRLKAEDFMQDLFTKIIYNPDRYDPERPFKTWLYSIANNMCKNEYKKQEVRNTVNSEIQNNAMVMSEHTGGGVEIDNEAFGIMLRKHVDELDEHHKTTFILRFYQELPIKEIGKIMQCSEGTVKSRLFYTLKKLAVKMKAYRLHYTT